MDNWRTSFPRLFIPLPLKEDWEINNSYINLIKEYLNLFDSEKNELEEVMEIINRQKIDYKEKNIYLTFILYDINHYIHDKKFLSKILDDKKSNVYLLYNKVFSELPTEVNKKLKDRLIESKSKVIKLQKEFLLKEFYS